MCTQLASHKNMVLRKRILSMYHCSLKRHTDILFVAVDARRVNESIATRPHRVFHGMSTLFAA